MLKWNSCRIIGLAALMLLMASHGWSMTRTLKDDPAIVIAAFGTTTRAMVTFDIFEAQLRNELPEADRDLPIRWAFTSEIVRERANKKFAAAGNPRRFLSLPQVLANLEAEGYRKIAVQPLHIFPGQEYQEVKQTVEAFRLLDLRIAYGGTLLHEWPEVFEAVTALEENFISPEQGCNLLVVHGTPKTFPGSNSTYLGLDRYLEHKYSNVYVGGVDGILTREQALDRVRQCRPRMVKMIPFMYVAGDHIMNDIMGAADNPSDPSWAVELRQDGISVDVVSAFYDGQSYFKGLGFYPEINRMFIRQLRESLRRLQH